MPTITKPKQRKPRPYARLWGIWLPDGGADHRGCWMQHASDCYDGPEAYTDKTEAEAAADHYRGYFPGCYVAQLTTERKEQP